MFTVYRGYSEFPQTSVARNTATVRMGHIVVAPADLVKAFGPPGESDQYKSSGEWTFYDDKTGAIFTLYDWKKTSLYDWDYPSPEQFWSSEEDMEFNIGGNSHGDLHEFIQLVLQQIQWVKIGKPFETEIIGTTHPTSGLFLMGKKDDET